MYSLTPKLSDCVTAKQAMRSHFLKKLRSWALSCPDERQKYSITVCDALFNYLHDKYLFTPNSKYESSTLENRAIAGASAMPLGFDGFPVKRRQLYVCATLPLYYEVDILPLLDRLWSWREASEIGVKWGVASNSSIAPTEVFTMVPVVVDPIGVGSKLKKAKSPEELSTHYAEWHHPVTDAHIRLRRGMTLVEVYDAKDLRDSFEICGPLKLRELKSSEFESFFMRRRVVNQGWGSHSNVFPGTTGPNSRHPRRILPCGDWESLFPEHLPPPGLLWPWGGGYNYQNLTMDLRMNHNDGDRESSDLQRTYLLDGGSEVSNVDVVVLTPGVCFQWLGGLRLGKGGGFYDRFLNYLRSMSENGRMTLPSTPDNAPIDGSRRIEVKKHLLVEAIGVGFDQQVLSGKENSKSMESLWECVNEEDAHVDAIATPSSGIEKVDYIDLHRFNLGKGKPLHFPQI
ncbi:unnamed protein product [Phytomonas sp. EM1]|nr:unnamed protein product [Phytomonas sp. EM1]|eukprot:CCW65336.1 unnamed protein product [Phytomonas sp. isolate EM1]